MSETIEQRKRRLVEEANRKRRPNYSYAPSPTSYSPTGDNNDYRIGNRIGNGDVDQGSNDAGVCGDAGGGGVNGGSCD